MPTTRKRHLQQQRAQQLQEQQQQQQQQPPPPTQADEHAKQHIDMDTAGVDCQSVQPSSKAQFIKDKVGKEEATEPNDKAETLAVHKGFQAMLESDLYCAICREIYIDPLILNCAHSFCKFCLNHWLSKQVGCPSCRMVVVFQTENLALKDIVNKMIKTSSKEFQLERHQSLLARNAAEEQQRARGIKPMMEKKSFDDDGHARSIGSHHIRSWRGPNGATIWRTKLNRSGEIIRPEVPDDYSSDSSVSTTDIDDDDYDYDEHLDVEFGQDPRRLYMDTSDDESSNSTIDIVSDELIEESRRVHMNHLNILAGNISAESDEDYEIGVHDHSDSDSSMQGIESNSDHSAHDLFGVWNFIRRRRNEGREEMSTDEEEEDKKDDDEEGAPDSEREDDSDSTSFASSKETSIDGDEERDSDDARIIMDDSDAIDSTSDSSSSTGSIDSDTDSSDADVTVDGLVLEAPSRGYRTRSRPVQSDSDSDY